MKRFSIIFVLFCIMFSAITVQAQQKNIWRTLALIKFEKQHSANNVMADQKPRIEPMLQAMNGEEVTVKGYVIPLSGKIGQSHFMFSAYPYASCFFCGKAGAESVMEVFTKDDEKVAYSEQAIYMKGKFKYLGYKYDDIMFALEEATKVEQPE